MAHGYMRNTTPVTAGYPLVYEVPDAELVVTVIAVGRREKGEAYARAKDR